MSENNINGNPTCLYRIMSVNSMAKCGLNASVCSNRGISELRECVFDNFRECQNHVEYFENLSKFDIHDLGKKNPEEVFPIEMLKGVDCQDVNPIDFEQVISNYIAEEKHNSLPGGNTFNDLNSAIKRTETLLAELISLKERLNV